MNRRTFLGTLAALAVAPAVAISNSGIPNSKFTGPAVDGADQRGSTLRTDGWARGARLERGDVVTIAGQYAWNPRTGRPTGHLQQFVVTSDVTADDDRPVYLKICPAIYVTPPFRNAARPPRHRAAVRVRTLGPLSR